MAAGGQPLAEPGRYSADWLDFFGRDPRHGSESYVFIGWMTPLVAIAGLVVLARTDGSGSRRSSASRRWSR